MSLRTYAPALCLAFAALGCPTSDSSDPGPVDAPGGKADGIDEPLPADPPKRVILLIGDGMGLGAITGATYAKGEPLNMLSMDHAGFMTTHEHEFVTTDSAASATAIASGIKSHFGAIGVLPGTEKDEEQDPDHQVFTVVDAAQQSGWRTGLIATTSVVDATPAAFAAHRRSRKSKADIAVDLRNSGVDVLLGGGRKRFDQRSDGVNLLNRLRDDGYSIAKTKLGLRRASGNKKKVIGLLHEGDMPPVTTGERAMSLPEMVEEALIILDDENDDGFFLMVEGSQIDRREHEMLGPDAIAETLDFDDAVGVALEYARGRDDTLVIVTADHETGGLTIGDPLSLAPLTESLGGADGMAKATAFGSSNQSGPPPLDHLPLGDGTLAPAVDDARLSTSFGEMSLASRPFWFGPSFAFRAAHSPVMVPVFVEGAGSDYVARTRDNAELGARLGALIEADGEAGPAKPPEADESPTNIVVIAADMAGLPALTAAHYNRGELVLEGLPVRGLVASGATDRLVADEAAAATALAAGVRTQVGAVGMQPDGAGTTPALSFLHRAETAERLTALVTTASLSDPGVASFYAHDDGSADGAQRVDALAAFHADTNGLDLVFGGGSAEFGTDAIDDWAARGAEVELEWSDDQASAGAPLVRLIAEGQLDPAANRLDPSADQPSLEEMTAVALEHLGDADEPFAMLVYADELGRVSRGHESGAAITDAVLDLDGAVRAAVTFAQGREDTLVVVVGTRDSSISLLDNHYGFHAKHCGATDLCGGPQLLELLSIAVDSFSGADGLDDLVLQGEFGPPKLVVQSSWVTAAAHEESDQEDPGSAHLTPIFATGPAARSLGGFRRLDELGFLLGNLASQ